MSKILIVANANIARRNKDNAYIGTNSFGDSANYAQFETDGDLKFYGDAMLRQKNVWHAYGGFQDANYTLAVDANTWTHITNGTNNLWTGLEGDGMTLSGDVMTITNGADYVGTLSMTFSGLNGKDYQIRLYNITQATQMGYQIGATSTGNANFTNVTLPLYLEVDSSDQLRMEMRCTTDGSDPILRSAVFHLAYLHD